jgi:acetyl esterase/lipase
MCPPIRKSRSAVPIIAHPGIAFASRREDDGPVRGLLLGLQRPAADGPHPLVVYVTGGGFMFVMKSNARELRTYVAESGFVVASIEYRTVTGGARWSDAVADVKEAVRFLRFRAGGYGTDAARVALWGESAGGCLAAP